MGASHGDRWLVRFLSDNCNVRPPIVNAADIGVFLCDMEVDEQVKIVVVKMALKRLIDEDCFTLTFHVPLGPTYRMPIDGGAYRIMHHVIQRDRGNRPEWAEMLSLLEFEMA